MTKRPGGVIVGAGLVAVLIAWLPAAMIVSVLTFVVDLSDDRDFNVVAFFVFYLTAAFCGAIARHNFSGE